MTKQEAIEILEEVKELDDSIYSYNSNYMEALEVAIEALAEKENFKNVKALKESLEQLVLAMCNVVLTLSEIIAEEEEKDAVS